MQSNQSKTVLILMSAFLLGSEFACATSKTSSGKVGRNSKLAGRTQPMSQKEKANQAFRAVTKNINRQQKEGKLDWAKAEKRFAALSQEHPALGKIWYNLGVSREKLGQLSEAESAYRKAISTNPNLSAARENLAAVVLRQGDKRQAISILRELVVLDPSASTARLALGHSLLAAGRKEEAIKLSQAALAADPKNIGGYCILALAAVESGENQRVRLLRNQAFKIETGAKRACLHFATGMVLLSEKRTAAALIEFSDAVSKDPKSNFEAWFRIAEISMDFKNFKRAVESYQAVCDLDPSNVEAHLNLGVALKGQGKFKAAETAYKKALSIAGKQALPEAHFNLGVLYLRNLESFAEAAKNLKKYIKLARPPQNAPVFTWLQEIEQRQEMESEMRSSTDEAQRK
jgi:tetratricopeptide (TPR) repeat protein